MKSAQQLPFLTDLDSRAAVKGSRDPLGVQAIWTRMGRRVVGNLTTVSTSVRDFTVTLLGYYFADRVAQEKGTSDDLSVFLRWEQLAAYARGGGNNDWEFRGTERTQLRWGTPEPIRLGTDSQSLILSDQKTYGLWGLYSVPSRSSGLVEGSPTRLTEDARRFVEAHYLPVLNIRTPARGEGLLDLLARGTTKFRANDRNSALFNAVAKVLRRKLSSAERDFYIRHLVDGGPCDRTKGGQRLLVKALQTTFGVEKWSLTPQGVNGLAKLCRQEGDRGHQVAEHLERIRAAEQLLAPCASLFAFLLSNDKQPIALVGQRVHKEWGSALSRLDQEVLKSIEVDLRDASGEPESASRWLNISDSLANADYTKAIELLLVQNREVMLARGGAAPWAEIRDGKLEVKFVAEDVGSLPVKAKLPSHWINPYFLDALRTVSLQLVGPT